ncbi:type II secretion system protein GspL [Achromobacter pestifer]|nr:type II secretion system protein GspL [Achromobacter pestifer]
MPQGAWQSDAFETLAALSARYQPKRVEVCPHPGDMSMTEIDLPPLPAKRQRVAVLGAVELLALAPPKSLAVGFGVRNAAGSVPVAWMSASVLATSLRDLQQHGLPVHAVYPPPAFLPNPEEASWPERTAGAILIDDWAVVRTKVDGGFLQPVPAGHTELAQVNARLQPLLPDSSQLHWLDVGGPVDADSGQAPTPWTGGGWNWTIPTGITSTHGAEHRWLGPALGWAATAAAVWLVGLNLYASQVAAQGQALTRQMSTQVKAAFPEVSVVLNPLQQARQLRDARRAGAVSVDAADFGALTRAAAALLTQAEGQVQRLDFRDGQLTVRWREGAAPNAEELKSIEGRAHERGLAVHAEDGGLRLNVAAEQEGDASTPSATAAADPPASGATP